MYLIFFPLSLLAHKSNMDLRSRGLISGKDDGTPLPPKRSRLRKWPNQTDTNLIFPVSSPAHGIERSFRSLRVRLEFFNPKPRRFGVSVVLVVVEEQICRLEITF